MNPNSSGDSNNRNSHLNVQGDEAPPPPYSETDVYSNSGSSRSPHPATAPAATPSHSFVDDAASSTAGDTIYTPPLTPRTSSGSGQPAAALYFDLRPVPQQNSIPREAIIHTIEVNDASRPDDFPFQNEWAARDITTLDWSTFINFLIPDHTTRENEAIIHRKLLDEAQSSAGHSNDSATQVEAQLGHVADTGIAPNPDAVQRRRDAESTVRQWNDGFFGPRGIEIRLEPLRTTPAHMPGAWEANFDQRSEPGQSTQPPQTTGRSGPAGWGPWANLQIDNNGVRYGNGFVADSNGLRIGNLVMDHNGIRFQNDESQDQQQQQQNERDIRGRAAHQQGGSCPNEKDGHKRSSSCSSSSSSSSSSSASSIGSLPSYDDVPQSSIQLYINRLQDWTKNPDQLRTRSDIKQLKAELKSVPKNRDVDLEVDKKALRAQIKALTAAWRQIKKAQRKERRSRKRERRERRRAERRERRQHKREMKRARRDARRCGATPVPPVPGPPPPPCIPPMPPHPPAHAVPSVPPVPPVPPVQPPSWSGGFPWGRGRGRGEHHHDPRHHDPHHNPHHHGPHRGGWGSWSNGRPPRGRGRGDNGMFGSRGPFGGDGPFGPSGPFGPEGPFGSGGPFGPGGPFGEKGIFGGGGGGPFGLFGSNSEEQQRQQQQGLQQQYQEHRRQYQEQQQQHQEQHRQHQEQHRQHQEQHRQHQEQQQEQMRQQLQQLQQQLHQSSGSSSRSVPGSWPDEKKDPSTSTLQDDQQVPLPGPVASAKYRAMEDIEAAIHHHLAAAEEAEPGPAKEALEKSIAEMMKKLEFMRVEADEEYARELSDR